MSKKNNDFFKKKKDWSMVKDELLGCYFQPYVSKILLTYRPLLYVDCFAGKGKFDDGNSGSPIIALDIINKGLEQTNATSSKVETCFIELNHAKELEHNLSGYPDTTIISGKYEDEIEKILSKKNDYNVFLYIDPYGIKALQCSLFDDFSKGQFNSIELLINMNSFGFIREACRAFGIAYNDVSVFDDLIEYDTTKLDSSDKSIDELNEIAGGDYWQNIITQYKNKMIDGYQAEDLFAKSYCDRLKQSYKYVLNMPLRIKKGQRPKYRMIHATNHRDGCLLMVDNIWHRWESMREIQEFGQMSLFHEDFDNKAINQEEIQNKVVKHYQRYDAFTSLYDSLADFFVENGTICSTSIVKNVLKNLEKEEKLLVNRKPQTTSTGRRSTFFSENKNQGVMIKWSK